MLPSYRADRKGGFGMRRLGLMLCALVLAFPAAAEPPAWTVDPAASRLGFTVLLQKAPVVGVFQSWRADIRFSPDDLAGSRVAVEIETGSADTDYADRDAELKKPGWFAIEAFPTATFAAETFRHLSGDAYEADGLLTIKGTAKELTLPFTLAIDGDVARMKAEIPLSRLAFNIGEGEWSATAMLKEDVTVQIEVTANRQE